MKFNVTVDGFGTFNTTVGAGGTVTPSDVASIIHSATGKTTPVDADELPLIDSAASNVLKKLTWANLKATLKTYFDAIYLATRSFGTAAALDVGTTANKVVQLTAAAKLPAVDGSLLTGISTSIPPQGGNNGKLLTTDGSALSWGIVPGTVATLDSGSAIGDVPVLTASTPDSFPLLDIPDGYIRAIANNETARLAYQGVGGYFLSGNLPLHIGNQDDTLFLEWNNGLNQLFGNNVNVLAVQFPSLTRDTAITWPEIDGTVPIIESGGVLNGVVTFNVTIVSYDNTGYLQDRAATGSPEGVVTANRGSTYRRKDGGAGTCFYVKESGDGTATGWVAK